MSNLDTPIKSTDSIRDIIITSVTFVEKDTPVSIVAKKLLTAKGRTVIVGDSKNPLGLITDNDFVQLEAYANPYEVYTAEELMSFPIITAEATISFEEAFKIFQTHSIHRFLVVENNEIIGLLTIPILMISSNIVVEKLREKVSIDALTGLRNKTSFNQILISEFNNINRHRNHTESIVLFVDIDHFKRVNDTYGHLVGDIVLREFASLLKEQIRLSDEVGRFGGEEFILLLRRITLNEALLFAERLRKAAEKLVFNPKKHNIILTISLGVFPLSQGENTTDVLSKADDALYHAKHNGRNCTGYWKEGSLTIFRDPDS